MVVSFSSIKHDGLRRYCDPITPDGDVAAMREFLHWVRPRGLLLIGVPLGSTEPAFLNGNKKRYYGRERFTDITNGWSQLHTEWHPGTCASSWPTSERCDVQPWHVLQEGSAGRGHRHAY